MGSNEGESDSDFIFSKKRSPEKMIKLLATAAMFPVRLVAIRSTDGKELPSLIEDATEEDHAHSRKKKESIPDYMNGRYSKRRERASRIWKHCS